MYVYVRIMPLQAQYSRMYVLKYMYIHNVHNSNIHYGYIHFTKLLIMFYYISCNIVQYVHMFTGIPTIADLQCTVNLLMAKSLRENTRKTYTSAQNRYIHFCQLYGQTPMPATEQVLLLYIAYLYDQKLSHSTVHVYLAAVRSLHIFHGYNNIVKT